jgi:hypothetical protein
MRLGARLDSTISSLRRQLDVASRRQVDIITSLQNCGCSSVVEHLLAKEDVASSSLVTRSLLYLWYSFHVPAICLILVAHHMDKTLKFHCDFGNGTAVTINVDLGACRHSRQDIVQKVEWEGNPAEEIFPQYLEWMHTVNTEIAKAIDRKYTYIFHSRRMDEEIWMYYPDGYRERLKS